jgi:hypothetical protein
LASFGNFAVVRHVRNGFVFAFSIDAASILSSKTDAVPNFGTVLAS